MCGRRTSVPPVSVSAFSKPLIVKILLWKPASTHWVLYSAVPHMPGNNTEHNETSNTHKSSIVSILDVSTDDDVFTAASASTHEPGSYDSISASNSTKEIRFAMKYLEKKNYIGCILVNCVPRTRLRASDKCCPSLAETIWFRPV